MIPGVDGPCTRDNPCPKNLDPGGISWIEGCWAYGRTRCDWEPMKVWVVVSDCGLNGPIVHGVYSSPPDNDKIQDFVQGERLTEGGVRFRVGVASTTGYAFTEAIEMELDGDLK